MNRSIPLFFGVFMVMALSNAIVPVLPMLDDDLALQSIIFSAYFFGAMLMTLPAGVISDRIGQPKLIIAALLITIVSGFLIIVIQEGILLVVIRIIEGFGAGIFVSAALSWINYQPGHLKLTSIFMAGMNFGLLFGLMGSGWMVSASGDVFTGVLIFTLLSILALIFFLFLPVHQAGEGKITRFDTLAKDVGKMIVHQSPLWYSVVVLLGITGFVQAVFPDLSGLAVQDIGSSLAVMNLATIISSLLTPMLKLEPVRLIRVSSLLMAGLVFLFLTIPASIFLMGAVAGFIMVSQIAYLAMAEVHQGVAMGLYTTFSYAGMAFIPALGGFLTDYYTLQTASIIIAILAFISAIIIGRCKCKGVTIS